MDLRIDIEMRCVPELSDGDQLCAVEVRRLVKPHFAWLLVRLIKAVSNLSTKTRASEEPTSLCVMRGLKTLSEKKWKRNDLQEMSTCVGSSSRLSAI